METIKQSVTNECYDKVNKFILSQLENGKVPWTEPSLLNWKGFHSYATGNEYSLLNRLLLGKPGCYITFNEVKAQGGSVKGGAKSYRVFFSKWIEEKPEGFNPYIDTSVVDNVTHVRKYPVFRSYPVFHIDDTIGVTPKNIPDAVDIVNNQPISATEDLICEYLSKTKIQLDFKHAVGFPGFNPYTNSYGTIYIAPMGAYADSVSYYKDLLKVIMRSTAFRLRKTGIEALNGKPAALVMEEMIAEMGSIYLCAALHIDTVNIYKYTINEIENWTSAINGNKKIFVAVCNKAEQAAKYVLETCGIKI